METYDDVSDRGTQYKEIIWDLWYRYKHFALLSLYGVCQIWFNYLERNIVPEYFMYSPIDDYIPFLKIFVVPYLYWFAYMAIGFIYLGIVSKKDYYRLCWYIFGGMCICYTLYMIFPNAQNLRPHIVDSDIFSRAIANIYRSDTNTNVAPSIHVLNSIAVHVALINSEAFKEKSKAWHWISLIVAITIILSTMFIKQHSIKDVMWACILSAVLYLGIYTVPDFLAEKDVFATNTNRLL